MTLERVAIANASYLIHHQDGGEHPYDEAGWYFEPDDPAIDAPFSPAFPTREAAIEAATAWETLA